MAAGGCRAELFFSSVSFLQAGGYLPFGRQLVPRALDAAQVEISGLQFEYQSLDPAIAQVGRRNGT